MGVSCFECVLGLFEKDSGQTGRFRGGSVAGFQVKGSDLALQVGKHWRTPCTTMRKLYQWLLAYIFQVVWAELQSLQKGEGSVL